MKPTEILNYDPEVDIASICLEEGRAVSTEYPWGLIDRDRDTGRVVGFVIWQASKMFPPEMIDAMRTAGKPHNAAA